DAAVAPAPGAVALAWPYRSRADVVAAGRLAADGWRVRVATRGFTAAGRRFSPGSFVLRLSEQPDSLPRDPAGAAAAVARAGASAVALTRSGTDDGVDLGSDRVRALRHPRIAIAAGPAASPTSFGAVRWLLEAEAGLPVDVVRLEDLGAAPGADRDSLAGRGSEGLDLGVYSAIVLPDGPGPDAWAAALGEGGARRLERWIEAGGTLVGVRAAAEWLTADRSGISEVERAEPAEPDDDVRRTPRAEREALRLRERIPGTILAVDVDTTSALGWGYDDGRAAVLVREPVELELAEEGNVWIYRDADPLSGYLPVGARERLAGAPWAIVEERGRGRIVLFADDPAFRGIARGTEKAYLNAVLLVPE
ncbi:MAG TPA: hypothetical protein VM778_13375, partial [Gemmatimonadota bacterium]|nr:hypothetical protein [Gemmatimonadota bacterium]